jgi:thioredoxin-like negative regulator of GroEL
MISKAERHILFTSKCCVRCEAMKAQLQAARVMFIQCSTDTDAGKNMALKFGVRGLPALALMVDGKFDHAVVGLLSRQQIEEIFR